MASSRKGVSNRLATVVVLAGVAGLCWYGAREGTDFIEKRSEAGVRSAMISAGQDWVQVRSDGLQVRLSGTAPDEVERFRAVTEAGKIVDSSRIVDEITVTAAKPVVAPDFTIELLRNDDGISLIGLVPASTDRKALVNMLERETAAPKVTDLLEQADYPAPDTWEDSLNFAMRAAQLARQAKISIEPRAVRISILAESRDEKGRLETELNRLRPQGVKLETDISAPRPVIAPFTTRFLIDDQGARFDACAADNEAGQERILRAAIRAGAKGQVGCTLALGAPSPDWADAVVASIGAVAALGQGTVTISNADIALTIPPGVERSEFDKATVNLEQALPDVFTLHAELEAAPEEGSAGPFEFTAVVSPSRELSMRGRVTGEKMQEVVDSFARARFADVQGKLRNDENAPAGWTVKVMAALEALDGLQKGSLKVTPDLIELTGDSGNPRAAEQVAAVLSKRLGAGAHYKLAIRYDRRLDPALALPNGDECVRRLNNIMSEATIGFEPNKSTIAGDPSETLNRLAEAMTDCSEFRMEAGGHTDSQGSEGFNADLSRARAQAVVTAMSESGIDTANMTSRGYGESRPIATNDTEEGREENRRIEFRLVSSQPVRSEPLAAPETVEGVTSADDAKPVNDPEIVEVVADQDEDNDVEIVPRPRNDAPAAESGAPAPEQQLLDREQGAAPATMGASEQYQPLDEREENIRLPVQTPDEDTPRPSRRPDTEEDGGDEGQEQQSEAAAE